MTKLLSSILFIIFFLLTGCKSERLISSLTEKQGIEIVSVLAESGISSYIERSDDGSTELVSVTVGSNNYSSAVQILKEKNLPSPREITFQEVIGSKGFLPEGAELRSVRLDRAEAAEIEQLIDHIPGVKRSHVIVRRRGVKGVPSITTVIIPSNNELEFLSSLKEHIEGVLTKVSSGGSDVTISVTVVPDLSVHEKMTSIGIVRSDEQVKYITFDKFLFFWRVASGDTIGLAITCLFVIMLSILLGYILGISKKVSNRSGINLSKVDNTATMIVNKKELRGDR